MSLMKARSGRSCGNCKTSLTEDRIICMDCITTNAIFDPFDICNKSLCLSSEVTRADLKNPHLPSHRMFKVRKFLLLRDLGRTWTEAKDTIERGDELLSEILKSYVKLDREDQAASQCRCRRCQNMLTLPCWFCIHCQGRSQIMHC